MKIRKRCKVCNKLIVENRFRIYCSTKCRNKFYNKKNRKYQTDWQRKNYYKKVDLLDQKDRVQCLICGKFFVQVGSHITQKHNLTAREYRREYGFDVKKGQLPSYYKKIKGDLALENGTYKNLKNGKKCWFKKGQEGVGIYKRSKETLKRLSNLYKFNKRKTKNI